MQLAEVAPDFIRALSEVMLGYRTRSGVSQLRLANDALVDVRSIRDLEHGRHGFNMTTVARLLSVLGVSWQELGRDLDAALERAHEQHHLAR